MCKFSFRGLRGNLPVVFVLLLFMYLSGCSSGVLSSEEQLLLLMKKDELALYSLYDSPNITNKSWVESYLDFAEKFQNYSYAGFDESIKSLLRDYSEYGMAMQKVGDALMNEDFEAAKILLAELKEVAKINEEKLQRMYDENK